jgi:pimeloyl-ACP methyl ester carboxylesterase
MEATMNKKVQAQAYLTGLWKGSFEFQKQMTDMTVDFDADTISIPKQGLHEYPIQDIAIEASAISFALPLGGTVRFSGKRNGPSIRGVFQQPGAEGPFELTCVGESSPMSAAAAENRPPSPAEASPTVRNGQVTLDTGTGMLNGTLTLPEGTGPFPLVLIIAGSGPTDRDGNSRLLPGKNNSLKMLAEGLAGIGIAALRYDKRGIAASAAAGTDESKVTFDTFIDDAVAWIEQLKPDSRFSDFGVIGHSEGSLIGIMASQRTGVHVFVSISGSGKPINEILLDQLNRQMPTGVEEAGRIIDSLRRGKTVEQVSPQLQSLFRPGVQPFLISLFPYDPAEEISKLEMPVLIVNGRRDLQTDVSQARVLSAAKPEASLCIIDSMNHVLKDAPRDQQGNLATYSDPALPLAWGLLKCVGSFLQSNLR